MVLGWEQEIFSQSRAYFRVNRLVMNEKMSPNQASACDTPLNRVVRRQCVMVKGPGTTDCSGRRMKNEMDELLCVFDSTIRRMILDGKWPVKMKLDMKMMASKLWRVPIY